MPTEMRSAFDRRVAAFYMLMEAVLLRLNSAMTPLVEGERLVRCDREVKAVMTSHETFGL